ncbi:hypothetical protein PG990_005663 [Apiospora arundinis]
MGRDEDFQQVERETRMRDDESSPTSRRLGRIMPSYWEPGSDMRQWQIDLTAPRARLLQAWYLQCTSRALPAIT